MDWINMAKGREKWLVAVNMVMNLGFQKMQGICWLDKLLAFQDSGLV
jgi:hypothetical protein